MLSSSVMLRLAAKIGAQAISCGRIENSRLPSDYAYLLTYERDGRCYEIVLRNVEHSLNDLVYLTAYADEVQPNDQFDATAEAFERLPRGTSPHLNLYMED